MELEKNILSEVSQTLIRWVLYIFSYIYLDASF